MKNFLALAVVAMMALGSLIGCVTDDAGDGVDYSVEGEDSEGKADQPNPTVYCVDPATGEPERADCVVTAPELGRAARKFLEANPRLYELRAGHQSFATCTDYNDHVYERDMPVSAQRFIEAITSSQPRDLWSGSSTYKLSYDRATHAVYGPDDLHPAISKGMVFVLTLKVAPLFYLPVSFEIVELDPAAGRFAFSYVIQNKSQGLQQLVVTNTATGSHVRHETRFKSDSEFRDNNLYVPFHEKLVAEFYQAVEATLARTP